MNSDLTQRAKTIAIEYYSVTTDKLYHLFTDHPQSRGLTYPKHLFGALKYSAYSSMATIIFLIHAFFPFLFPTKGSHLIKSLYNMLTSDGAFEEYSESDEGDDENTENGDDGDKEDDDDGNDRDNEDGDDGDNEDGDDEDVEN